MTERAWLLDEATTFLAVLAFAWVQEATTGASRDVAPQATGTGVLDVVMLTIALPALGAGAVAAAASIRSVRLTRDGLSKQDEQLELARRAASMVPELEVVDVRYLATSAFPVVAETLDEAERSRQEKRRDGGSRLSGFDVSSFDPFVISQRDYRGGIPDTVLEIRLKNGGRTAAQNITGTIGVESNRMRILDFPGLDASNVTISWEDGLQSAELGTIEELLPGKTGSYEVAVFFMDREEGWRSRVKYDFIMPAGFGKSGGWVPPSEPDASGHQAP